MELSKRVLELTSGKNFALFGTIAKDGYPHVTPVWVDNDGKNVIVNTAMGRVKQKNVQEDPKVSITVQDGANPYSYIYIKGTVIEQRTEGADEHIDKLSERYIGKKYPYRTPGEKRVMIIIKPEKIVEQ